MHAYILKEQKALLSSNKGSIAGKEESISKRFGNTRSKLHLCSVVLLRWKRRKQSSLKGFTALLGSRLF